MEEECDETQFWLDMLRDSSERLNLRPSVQSRREIERLIQEADEVLRITIAAKKTTRARMEVRHAKVEVRNTAGQLRSSKESVLEK